MAKYGHFWCLWAPYDVTHSTWPKYILCFEGKYDFILGISNDINYLVKRFLFFFEKIEENFSSMRFSKKIENRGYTGPIQKIPGITRFWAWLGPPSEFFSLRVFFMHFQAGYTLKISNFPKKVILSPKNAKNG